MKLLFLDFDGVLNSHQCTEYHRMKKGTYEFAHDFDALCPIALSNLNYLLEQVPDLYIVISSTWRKHYEFEEFEKGMEPHCPRIKGRIIGITPTLGYGIQRGDEIDKYLQDSGLYDKDTQFVVFDDDSDMDKVRGVFVHVDSKHGLQWDHIEKACWILRGVPLR